MPTTVTDMLATSHRVRDRPVASSTSTRPSASSLRGRRALLMAKPHDMSASSTMAVA